jgi:histone deacetylase 11
MNFRKLIINRAAVKRIGFVYVPICLALYVLLMIAAFMTNRIPSPPLDLGQDFSGRLPIVYSEAYNIEFFGLENLHPFDTKKYRRILEILQDKQAIRRERLIEAAIPDKELLRLAHSQDYLDSLQSSWTLARVTELGFLRFFPAHLSRNVVLEPLLYQMGGSVLATKAALRHGWAVNLGGGFHHASYSDGGGFCPLADISLIIKYMRRERLAQKIMVVDLDAHQGNGHERDFNKDDNVYILDVYNKEVYPNDVYAKGGIDLKVELDALTQDAFYLPAITKALDKALAEFKPDLIIYNAGTDILSNDPLGSLDISPQGVIKRDEIVFGRALNAKIPIVMLLSGGYQKINAKVIADSLLNLRDKYTLWK